MRVERLRPELSDENSTAKDRLARLRRVFTLLVWYGLPAVAAVAVAAYIVGAVIWHANPPVVPVEGVSMRPTLHAGDLVLLKGVDPNQLHKGEIIAVRVPSDARSKYSLPAEIVHRIVRINHTSSGLVFVTKGDANPGNDVFTTPASDVVGREVAAVPGLGYPILFFRSRQGEIFIAALVVVGILYFLLGVFEERRAYSEGTAVAFEAILAETNELKETLAGREPGAREPPVDVRPISTTWAAPARPPEQAEGEETSEVMHELVGAIAEYGEHLRSHTAVMQGLAATTVELRDAASELRRSLGPERQRLVGRIVPLVGLGLVAYFAGKAAAEKRA